MVGTRLVRSVLLDAPVLRAPVDGASLLFDPAVQIVPLAAVPDLGADGEV